MKRWQDTDPVNLVITGVGGQGNVLASQLLGQCLVQKELVVTVGETYGASQRGGSVMSHLRVSASRQWAPLIPTGRAHMVVGLEPMEALRVLKTYGNPDTVLLTNTRPIYPLDVIGGAATYPAPEELMGHLEELCREVWTVPATDIALKMGQPILSNMVMLGAIAAMDLGWPLQTDNVRLALAALLPAKAVDINLAAFEEGLAKTTRHESA